MDSFISSIGRILEALPEPALIVEDGVIRKSNAAAKAVLGPHIDGRDIRFAIRHPAAVEHLLGRSEHDGDEIEIVGLGEVDRRWTMHVSSLDVGAYFATFTDQSEKYAAERMRVDFVANASHELRTPLSNMIGYTETLLDEAGELDAATRTRFLAIAYDEARRMQRIVEDLISLSRIEAERFSSPTDRLDLDSLVREVSAANQRMATDKDMQIDVQSEPELPTVIGDRVQLTQVIDNLIANALRYGRAGTPVTIATGREGPMVRIAVADQGQGIAAEHIPRLTERFYRVDANRSRALGGTGLGLAIVKHIVDRHRGRLTIKSVVGQGTIVEVCLPVAGSNDAVPQHR